MSFGPQGEKCLHFSGYAIKIQAYAFLLDEYNKKQ